jgi:two-component system, OmpR family, KDP operon response regulator KdpE
MREKTESAMRGEEAQEPLILIVEDEVQMRRFLRPALRGHGYRVHEATTGEEGLREAATRAPNVVLLDLGLPDADGIEVTRRLREWTQIPIIVISARGREEDKVAALDAGADDYLTKPFGVPELLARLRVALRHTSRIGDGASSRLALGDLEIDLEKRRVTLGGEVVHLTPIEYRLLAELARNAGKVMTHSQLLRQVWGQAYAHQSHYLRVYMAQLRRKLEADPAQPKRLITEPGVGYRLAEP